MPGTPTPNERQIREQVGDRSFRLGLEYFESGAVFNTRREETTLKAMCHGSSGGPYRVQADLDSEGIAEAHCSCPVGAGGSCKHVAAMLLTWLHRPEAFTEVEPPDQSLQRRSKEELIALIKQMLRMQPELESLLELPLPAGGEPGKPASPEIYQRQAQAIFDSAGEEWGVESVIADRLSAILDIAEDFARQKHYANAAVVYRGVSSSLLQNYSHFHDEEGDLIGIAADCVEGLSASLAETKDDPATRHAILRALFEIYRFDVDFGGIGMSDDVPDAILKHTTPDERRLVAQWVTEAMPQGTDWSDNWHRQVFGGFLMELEQDSLDDEAFLKLARQTGRMHDVVARLLELGRVEEAIREAEAADDYELLELAGVFTAQGHADVAEGLILKRARTSPDVRIIQWLRDRALERRDQPAALKLSVQIFNTQPTLDEYKRIKKLADNLGQWEAWRGKLLSKLKSMQYMDLLINIYLREQQIDEALKVLKSSRGTWWTGGMELAVAEAAEKTHPHEALAIYRKRAERLIDNRGRDAYREACGFLKKVRSLHAQLNQEAQWDKYITTLREKHRTLRALLEEMKKAKL